MFDDTADQPCFQSLIYFNNMHSNDFNKVSVWANTRKQCLFVNINWHICFFLMQHMSNDTFRPPVAKATVSPRSN